MWILALGLALAPIATPDSARTSYEKYDFFELVAGAEHIVSGTILSLEDKTYELLVEEDYLGSVTEPKLRLERFVDWTCASRWGEYGVGQRVVVFIRDGRAMGAGNEGDWPIVEGEVWAPYRVRGIERRTRENEDPYPALETPLSTRLLATAIGGYRANFLGWFEDVEGGYSVLRVRSAGSRASLDEYLETSPLAKHLVEETLSSDVFIGADNASPAPRLNVAPTLEFGSKRRYASALVGVGDIDGDGWDDVATLTIDGMELVFVDEHAGVRDRRPISHASLGLEPGYYVEGAAALGDLDRDGVPDIAVTARSIDDRSAPSRLYAELLERSGSVREVRELRDDARRSLQEEPELYFGRAMTVVSDRGEHGTTQLLVDIDQGWDAKPTGVASRVFELDASGVVRVRSEIAFTDLIDEEHESDIRFGTALVSIGDLDEDGHAEVAIGHPYDSDGGDFRGGVMIASLRSDGTVRSTRKISDWSGGFEPMLRDDDQFGTSLAAPGDLDGDGISDLVVGGRTELWVLFLRRDGTVRESCSHGTRSGGLVALDSIDSLVARRGPDGSCQLLVAGTKLYGGTEDASTALWVLRVDEHGVLSAP